MQDVGSGVELARIIGRFKSLTGSETHTADDTDVVVGLNLHVAFGTVVIVTKIGNLQLNLRFNEDIVFVFEVVAVLS